MVSISRSPAELSHTHPNTSLGNSVVSRWQAKQSPHSKMTLPLLCDDALLLFDEPNVWFHKKEIISCDVSGGYVEVRIYEDYVFLSYGNKAGGSRDVLFKKNTCCTCISYQFCQFFFLRWHPSSSVWHPMRLSKQIHVSKEAPTGMHHNHYPMCFCFVFSTVKSHSFKLWLRNLAHWAGYF